MLATLKFLSRDDTAAVYVEYALLISLIAIAALAAVLQVGHQLRSVYHRVGEPLGHPGA